MSRSTRILIVVIGLLAALSSWLSHEEDADGLIANRIPAHIPDYYITGFSAAAYSADGVPRHRLSAENMSHFADDRSTLLVQPKLAFLDDKGESWQLDAGRGLLDSRGEKLLLSEKVHMRHVSADAEAIELLTGEITVEPLNQFATTRTPVTITGPTTHIEAAGFDAHFSEERLVLYSVRGRYEP